MTGRPVRGSSSAIQASSARARVSSAPSSLVEAGRALEHAPARGGRAPRRWRTAPRARPRCPGTSRPSGTRWQQGARGREAERAGVDRLVDEGGHRGELVGGGAASSSRPRSPIDVVAHGAVADHAADVDALGQRLERVEVLAVGLPVPRQPVEDAARRDVLDRLHHLGEDSRSSGCTGAKVTPQLPMHHRGDAVPARRRRTGPSRAGRRGGCGCRRSRG